MRREQMRKERKKVITLVFKVDAVRCNHHSVDLKDSSAGEFSPTAAASCNTIRKRVWAKKNKKQSKRTRCSRVRITAFESGPGPFIGMITSGFDRTSKSRSCRGSCVPNTARYVSSQSSC